MSNVNQVSVAQAVAAILGNQNLTTDKGLIEAIHNIQAGEGALKSKDKSISLEIMHRSQAVVAKATKVKKADRKAHLAKAMRDNHAALIAAGIKSGVINLDKVDFPEVTTNDKGVRVKGTQILGRYYSVNAPEVDSEPTAELLVMGYQFKNIVSWVGILWELKGSQAVAECETTTDLLKAKNKAQAELTPKADETKETDPDTDQALIYSVFGQVTTAFDLTGKNLKPADLIALADTLITFMDKTDLTRKAG